jgi:hypothetical protein
VNVSHGSCAAIRRTILDLHDSGVQAPQLARQLNGQSLRTVTGGSFGDQVVCTWISRYRRVQTVKSPCPENTLPEDEQRAADPARKLEMNASTVVRWIRQKRLEGPRQVGGWRLACQDCSRYGREDTRIDYILGGKALQARRWRTTSILPAAETPECVRRCSVNMPPMTPSRRYRIRSWMH